MRTLLISLSILYLFQTYALDPVFEHLNFKDYKVLKHYLLKTKSWRIAKNEAQDGPLAVAIKNKDIKSVEILCRYGANINEDNIIELAFDIDLDIALMLASYPELKVENNLILKALYKLFNIEDFDELIDGYKRKIDLKNKNYSFAVEILLHVRKEKEEENIKKVLSVADLFASRVNLAKLLHELYIENHLTKMELNNILDHYEELFLKDQILNANTLAKIIAILSPLNINRNLLRIILTNYLRKENDRTQVNTTFDNLFVNSLTPSDNMVLGILNLDLELFSKLAPKIFFLPDGKKGRINFKNAAMMSNKIAAFVQFSTLWSKSIKEKNLIYDYWLLVLDELKTKGDLFGASTIAAGLSNSGLIRPKKDVEVKLNLIDPNDNFKVYRKLIKKIGNNFLLPNIGIISHDITSLMEKFSLETKNNFNYKYINFLWQSRKELNIPYNLGKKLKDKPGFTHKELLKELAPINDDLLYALHKVSIYEPKIEEQLLIKDIKTWNITDIEKFINNCKINPSEKGEFFNFLVRKMNVIDGKSLLYQVLEWPKKMVDILAKKQSKQSLQHYLNLNLIIYEIMNEASDEDLNLSEDEKMVIEEQNKSINSIVIIYKQLFSRMLDKKRGNSVSFMQKSRRLSFRNFLPN